MMAGFVSIDRPCSAYSGKTTRSMPDRLARALATMETIRAVCPASSAGVETTGNCNCTRPMTTPLGLLLRPPSPFMPFSYRVMESSPGAARRASFEFEDPTMMSSVRM